MLTIWLQKLRKSYNVEYLNMDSKRRWFSTKFRGNVENENENAGKHIKCEIRSRGILPVSEKANKKRLESPADLSQKEENLKMQGNQSIAEQIKLICKY